MIVPNIVALPKPQFCMFTTHLCLVVVSLFFSRQEAYHTCTSSNLNRIVQRGAVPPLVAMLHSSELQLKEMAAFALGRLAQNGDNQAGIVQSGGLQPLLSLLDSDSGNLQHNAAFALYGLADNEDNIADIIREDGVRRLLECKTIVQQSKDCVQKTLKRLEEKLKARDPPARRPIARLMYLMQNSSSREVRQRFATAMAYLVTDSDLKLAFAERGGLAVLLDMLRDKNKDLARRAAGAFFVVCVEMFVACENATP